MMETIYFLVRSVEENNKKILLYNIINEKPVDATKLFKIYDYNL